MIRVGFGTFKRVEKIAKHTSLQIFEMNTESQLN